jgi:hypothetical protein
MSAPSRWLAFGAGLAVIFGLAFFVGGLAGPDVEVARHEKGGHEKGGHEKTGHEKGGHGKSVRSHYRLALGERLLDPGRQELAFRVLDRRAVVTAYETRHEKELHLVVVSRDLVDYQHVHPVRDADGTWRVEVRLGPGMGYRVYADTQPSGGDPVVLEARLATTGHRPFREAPRTEKLADTVDGYDVALVWDDGEATVAVSRDGAPVDDLEPYLGAFGHLVVIRAGSMDYLHAHPEEGPAGPAVRFGVEIGRPGVHRLFFDFQHDGVVRTADFTVRARREGGHGH